MRGQNIYDDPEFFAGYSTLRRVTDGLDQAFEWPTFKRLLPASLRGLRVLDLGCGMGHFARAAREMGAREVVGVDLSERMLAEAHTRTSDPAIRYLRADIETYEPERDAFELVMSSLALHYVADYGGLAARVAATLRPGGRFVFSVEHPMTTWSESRAWHCTGDGTRLHWPVDRYRDQGPRNTHWYIDGVIRFHRTTETYVNGLIAAGMRLLALAEPEPEPEMLRKRPDLVDERRRPPVLILCAERER